MQIQGFNELSVHQHKVLYKTNCMILLDKDKLSDVLPTIDCYPNKARIRQALCHKSISGSFLDERYDRQEIWEKEIGWAIPSVNKDAIIDTINKFQERAMKGYVVVGTGFYSNSCEDNIWVLSGQQFWAKIQKKCVFCLHVPAYLHAKDTENNKFHSNIFYFNFQK